VIKHCLLAALCALTPVAVRAADDTQLWTTLIAQGPIAAGPGTQPIVWMEVQSRVSGDVSHLSQRIVRPGFGLRFAPDFSVLFGYQFQQNTPEKGRDTNEIRAWEQLTLPLYRDPETLMLTTRLRLEQRMIESAHDLGWRGRIMLRAQVPLHGAGSGGPLVWSEAFVSFNDTDWGQRTGLRQIRTFAGGLIPVTKHLNFEVGYMAQFERTPGNTHVNHVANLALNYRLGK
jgi:hypothetical protein